MSSIYIQSIGVWFVFVVYAIINGAIRNLLYQNKTKELTAHQISSVTGIVGFTIIIFIFLKLSNAVYGSKDLLVIGVMWVVMTVIFEFLFGRFMAGNTWQKLLDDYNLLSGRLWVIVLLSILIGPWLLDWIFLSHRL